MGLAERRVRQLVAVAGTRGAGVDLNHLVDLLPPEAPATVADLADWIRAQPELGQVVGARVFAPGASAPGGPGDPARRDAYLNAAELLVRSRLSPIVPQLHCLLVTGSAAFGEPSEGDDCDLFGVVRDGALWVALTWSFLALRIRGPVRTPGAPSVWCFNYVLEAGEARAEFAGSRGFLFAREALTAVPLLGEEYYRSLLATAPWLRAEAPRLFERRTGAETGPPKAGRTSWAIRLLNLLLYPPVAAYLQAVGLVRNHRLARSGRSGERFRTITGRRRLALRSEKFDRLAEYYRGTSAVG